LALEGTRTLAARALAASGSQAGAKGTVSALQYDGYGNRVAETRASATTSYTYDAECRGSVSACADMDGTKGLSSAKARPARRQPRQDQLCR
jgi:hypothetical protein